MAVSYVAASSGSSGSATSTSFTTTLPSGWQAGDLAVLVAHVSGGTLNISTPAGWTLLSGITWPVAEGSASRLYAWSRVLQSGDAAPTLTNSGSVTGGWEMTAYRDASSVAQAATATASGTAVTLPTLTGVAAGSALVVGAHCRVASGTIPTGLTHAVAYTEVVDQATSRATTNANIRMGAAYRVTSSAGTGGGEQVTSDVTGSMIGLLVELTPASTTVAPTGIVIPVAVGAPTAAVALTAAPAGLAVPVAVGSPGAAWSTTGQPAGLALPIEVGAPTATWSAAVHPDGITAPIAAGNPAGAWSTTANPDGLLVPVQVGAPAVSTPGGQVVRPDTGTTTRPAAGLVARPNAGVVVRP